MTKTRNHGTVLFVDQFKNYGTATYNNGSVINQNPTTNYGQISRRIGETSSITTHTGRDGRFRPCLHQRVRYLIDAPMTHEATWYRQGTTSTSPTALKQALWTGLYAQALRTNYAQYTIRVPATTVPSIAWDTLANVALSNMLPSLVADNSLVNFILELKDFRKLASSLFSRNSGLLNTLKSAFSQEDYDKPLARVSKAYLSYQFAWRPLIRDIQSLYSSLSSLDARIQDVINRADTPQQRYFGTDAIAAQPVSDLWLGNSTAPQGGQGFGSYLNPRIRSRVTSESTAVRYHATVRYRYPVPPALRTAAGRTKALLDTLGLNRDPSIIWNAIPFSFVIDWFVNVGGFLKGLRTDNVPIKSEILDFCHSVKVERKVQLRHQSNSTTPGSPDPFTGAWMTSDTAIATVYERRVGVPDLRLALQTSGLSLREAVLSAALGGSRLR